MDMDDVLDSFRSFKIIDLRLSRFRLVVAGP
jgi:hypothetical protein